MIKIENVNKYFNRFKRNEVHVINDTSLELPDNGLVSLLGPSGSGKTTLLNAIGALDKVNSGNIYINGKKITKRTQNYTDKVRALNIGYIFQDFHLIDELTVFDNIALSLKMVGIKNKKEITSRVHYCLDALNMYRYRYRTTNMLSGGERQRVSIARALAVNPNIIIADEPTGNLDSKNSLEIMNIIKAISKTKLVVLVTHERDLADFYSSRIIELSDGKIISDKENFPKEDLDYKIDNKIYLKDLDINEHILLKDNKINLYSEKNIKLNITLVLKNNNIYIQSSDGKKIEVVDNSSSIELIDDNYKKISKESYEESSFNMDKISNTESIHKYSSIFNLFTLIKSGFKKVIGYKFLKKMLLLGFCASGAFILFSISNMFGIKQVNDKDFVTSNNTYITLNNKLSVNDYLVYEKGEDINYMLPLSSSISFNIRYKDYFQTYDVSDRIAGSLAGTSLISDKDLVYGVMPKGDKEIVLDTACIDKYFIESSSKAAGILSYKDMLNKELIKDEVGTFKVVGIVRTNSPSIYVNESYLINLLRYNDSSKEMGSSVLKDEVDNIKPQVIDYSLVKDKVVLTKGAYPNDYEVIVNEVYKNDYEIGKNIDIKINDIKLKIVGYYKSNETDMFLTNNNTIKYDLISNSSTFTISSSNKSKAISFFNGKKLNPTDNYEVSKKNYIDGKSEFSKISLIISSIILIISLIEIYLMMRSSFLSRVKEVGIMRAIGIKKSDIYKMFLGEILAITVLASTPGYLIMIYIIKGVITLPFLGNNFLLNNNVLIISIVIIYAFNIIVGLLPVAGTLRKKPAAILARKDVD
ncbi:MAG: ABC transporter ATP-binding protein/permease [Bacilli bacterium]